MDDDASTTNRRHWDERADFHLDTPMYREFVARLQAGHDALLPIDDRVLGEVGGLDVLHAQCHVGTDTLSLVRRGARVVGVDFSPRAIAQAQALSARLGLPARFVVGDVLDLPADLGGPFDLVYTSYGVLCWLGDLSRWARQLAAQLRVGGRLVVIDGHPLSSAILPDGIGGDRVTLQHRYLGDGTPERWRATGSYADPTVATAHDESVEWDHSLGEVVTAVAAAGLRVESLVEHPETFYRFSPALQRGDDRLWRLPPPLHGRFPLSFSLVARR